ncbi:MAG: hypothetical protein OQK82_01750 [Candidatus Pacearchaeota archaeon]|nr:hypothetical protein [Candidatus Pacearchaeota archaeon]
MTIQKQRLFYHSPTNSEGKIYFFRDTNHTEQLIQDRLFRAISKRINNRRFSKLFVEGREGLYFVNIESEEKLRKYNKIRNNTTDAHYLVLANHPDSQLIYGVGDPELKKEKSNLIKKFFTLREKLKQGVELSLEEENKYNSFKKLVLQNIKKYTLSSSKKIFDYMKKNNLNSAGVLFGEKHFKYMLDFFIENNFNVISYYPGKIKPNFKKMINYYNHTNNPSTNS